MTQNYEIESFMKKVDAAAAASEKNLNGAFVSDVTSGLKKMAIFIAILVGLILFVMFAYMGLSAVSTALSAPAAGLSIGGLLIFFLVVKSL